MAVALDPELLDDLRRRLRATRWPAIIGEDSWEYGVPQVWLADMVDYWANEWDWSAQADAMNAYDHFTVTLPSPVGGDAIPIHYMHVPSAKPDALPLICTHGWPWMFWDMAGIIEPLRQEFELIIPSLPGFAFSTPMTTPGVDVAAVADLWATLMTDVLGFPRFGAYGGDWGSMITAHLGHAYADRVVGAYMSLPVIPGVDRRSLEGEWADDEAWMLQRMAEAEPLIRTHVTVHRSDPQTISYALMDSPVGLAAWLWERRRNWSDCNGDVESVFSRDHLCTLATLYWATGAMPSSLRLYFEHFGKPWRLAHDRTPVIEAPAGYAVFGKELVFLPRAVAEARTNLHRWSVFQDGGGHFAPAERPDVIAAELLDFFGGLSV